MKSLYLLLPLFIMLTIACNPSKDQKVETLTPSNGTGLENVNTDEQEISNHEASFSPTNINMFIPTKYSILDSLNADLNQDGKKDLILLLKHDREANWDYSSPNAPDRPLLLLVRDKNNQLQLAKRNDKVAMRIDEGGVMGDPYTNMVFKNGYFSLEHNGGSNWRWSHIITFKFDTVNYDWYLHKIGGDSYHTYDIEKVETKVRSFKDFGKVKFEDFNSSKTY